MRGKVCLGILVFICSIPLVFAADRQNSTRQSQEAKVVKLERQVVHPDELCCVPNDKPVNSEYYAYDVSVRVGCTTYEGRYETPFDYFPLGIAPGKSVEVHVSKHEMNFNGPATQDLKVPITHRSTDKGCGVQNGGAASS